ncbi:hypothetical protein BHE74_00049733 [Ensete ventricosum]|nr:hypothetical protein GW17_00029977 [Ensete ventricosum]RWW44497.1 hypothetical protein BHE74_00049733 [Ensete ventricosum]RZS18566.1 hypothetical protein BHM03_00050854 [Ensete ventricosum]
MHVGVTGSWWHAGFHLTTAIVGPTILTLPYAFRGLGWDVGLAALTVMGAVTFYAYTLMSKVLDHCEKQGRRHIRFRELAADVLGTETPSHPCRPPLFFSPLTIFSSSCSRCCRLRLDVLFRGVLPDDHQHRSEHRLRLALRRMPQGSIMYSSLSPDGPLRLYHFIVMVTVVLILLSQLPSFHSLRHINLVSLLLSLGYTTLVAAGCINAEMLRQGTIHWTHPRFREPSMPSRPSPSWLRSMEMEYCQKSRYSYMRAVSASKMSLVDLPNCTGAGNDGTSGHREDGERTDAVLLRDHRDVLLGCSLWLLGLRKQGELQCAQQPSSRLGTFPGTHMATGARGRLRPPPTLSHWLGKRLIQRSTSFAEELVANIVPSLQVYSQVAYEIIEKNSADIRKSKFSKRNLVPRLILRTLYMVFCGFMAAMLPFFGDIVAVVGAIGFIPLDFVLPMLLYNISIGTSKRSPIHWINIFIMVVFTGVGIIGAFASIRKLVFDAHQFKLFSNDVVG